jgi:hypothetical protein
LPSIRDSPELSRDLLRHCLSYGKFYQRLGAAHRKAHDALGLSDSLFRFYWSVVEAASENVDSFVSGPYEFGCLVHQPWSHRSVKDDPSSLYPERLVVQAMAICNYFVQWWPTEGPDVPGMRLSSGFNPPRTDRVVQLRKHPSLWPTVAKSS